MSYILDALQKSQREQTAEGVALRVQPTPTRRSISSWLLLLLVVVLILNAAVLAWVFLLQDPAGNSVAQTHTPAATANTTPAAVPATAASQPRTLTPPSDAAAESTPPAAATAPERSPIPATAAPQQTVPAIDPASTTPAPTIVPVTRPSIPRVALRDLPVAEQSLYNGFKYSTHIYTDDPSLCAIVVDGQRLQAGDAFKGLKVTAITEQGVVFEENRRGMVREVEVDVLEQWER